MFQLPGQSATGMHVTLLLGDFNVIPSPALSITIGWPSAKTPAIPAQHPPTHGALTTAHF
jgi:hypothetical protein